MYIFSGKVVSGCMLTIYFFVVRKGMDNGAVGEELLY